MEAVHIEYEGKFKLGINVTVDAAMAASFDAASQKVEEQFLACHFLRVMDWERHGVLVIYLEDQYTLRVDMYPNDITQAYNLAIKYKGTHQRERGDGMLKALHWPQMWNRRGICRVLNVTDAIRWGISPEIVRTKKTTSRWKQ